VAFKNPQAMAAPVLLEAAIKAHGLEVLQRARNGGGAGGKRKWGDGAVEAAGSQPASDGEQAAAAPIAAAAAGEGGKLEEQAASNRVVGAKQVRVAVEQARAALREHALDEEEARERARGGHRKKSSAASAASASSAAAAKGRGARAAHGERHTERPSLVTGEDGVQSLFVSSLRAGGDDESEVIIGGGVPRLCPADINTSPLPSPAGSPTALPPRAHLMSGPHRC
jgi:ribosomal protein L12E/L44/L45/RPP1/RPP2